MPTKNKFQTVLTLTLITALLFSSTAQSAEQAFGFRPADSSDEILIFPKPTQLKLRQGKPFTIDKNTTIVFAKTPNTQDTFNANYIADRIQNETGLKLKIAAAKPANKDNFIMIGQAGDSKLLANIHPKKSAKPQGYSLDSNEKRILIAGTDPTGTFYGLQTLLQLARKTTTAKIEIPAVSIHDSPVMSTRGIFVECVWGSDLMDLDDWKNCINVMADLKLNHLGVGIYGSWGLQFRNQRHEFFMIPIKGREKLKTEMTIKYFSPAKNSWTEITYLPKMFTQDFFGQVVAYGKKRHIDVVPFFNSLGHNRLIPEVYPETSTKDANDNPVPGYAFCTSEPKTYEILFDCYDQIIDRYLKPNGIDQFNIQLDEVRDWCKCSKCGKFSNSELYIQHAIKIAEHLSKKKASTISTCIPIC